ncbi:hypothetical protein QVD17_12546 [Tagetes erecta]|uniref:Uncharacterized protein n=1 Tax=Tagetes erecta TaxID=13708 RepID=A0AAD8KVS1_TARER|nr:hypothetical protein QVD17_12546 [Tagetes erecta]
MDNYYEDDYEGNTYSYKDHRTSVWCEICGGPHYTYYCCYSQGYSTGYDDPYPYTPPEGPPSTPDLHTAMFEMNQVFQNYLASQHEQRGEECAVRLRESEDLVRRTEELGVLIDQITAKHQPESTFCDTGLCTDVVDDFSEPETIMDNAFFAIPHIYTHVPPPVQLEFDLMDADAGVVDEFEGVRVVFHWEDEFGDELFGISTLGEKGASFDPIGDLAELETLIFGEPERKCEEVQGKKEVLEETKQPHHIEYSRPVEGEYNGSRPISELPRERTRRGRFKDWWAESVASIRVHSDPIVAFFPTNGMRKKLSKTSGKRIKEKPSD